MTEWLWWLSWYFGGVLVILVAAVSTGIVEKAVTGIWLLLVVFFRIMTLGKVADWEGWDIHPPSSAAAHHALITLTLIARTPQNYYGS